MSDRLIVDGDRLRVEAAPLEPLAPTRPATLDDVVRPEHGHTLEDFVPGRIFAHPRGITVDRAFMLRYATAFMEANPLHLNEPFARSQGFDGLPAAPHLVLNLALSLGVQNDSEKAIANLGYYDVRFLRPVYPGDTLTGMTRVAARRDRGVDRPGIATVETLATNDRGEVVVQYRRKILVPRRGTGAIDAEARVEPDRAFPYDERPGFDVPLPPPSGADLAARLTSADTRLDALVPGRILVHPNGRTVTDEHVGWTYGVMNTHPLHFDRLYSTARQGPMSGEPIVYGGLVFAWLLGLASREATESAVWELGFHDGYHTQPTFAGDTLGALTRIVAVEEVPGAAVGVVRMQLVGVKNVRAGEALDRFGAALFELESAKRKAGRSKIPEKVFEIERSVLVRR